MANPWFVSILTLFPEIFPGPLGASLVGKALKDGLWRMETLDIRAFASDKHASVDDTPYGGGAGMVMRADVIDEALSGAEVQWGKAARTIYLSPRGKVLNQELVKEISDTTSVRLLCGRYEGIDQRVLDARGIEEVSLGDFVLAGGEVAAMTLIEACVRLIPGVVGNMATLNEESFDRDLLEYPHFTRPFEWRGQKVPEVLLSGHHENIRKWREHESKSVTQSRRPDLWKKFTEHQSEKLKEN